MPGTTGDIIWRRTEPKTIELYNVDRGPKDVLEEAGAPALQEATGKATTDQERAVMQGMMAAKGDPYVAPGFAEKLRASPKQKRQWRKQISDFLSEAGDPRADIDFGIQSLLDSGAVWQEEDGVYTSVPLRSEKQRQQMVDAVEGWTERQWDKGRTQYDPDVGWYNPQERIWEEAQKYPNLTDEERQADRLRRGR